MANERAICIKQHGSRYVGEKEEKISRKLCFIRLRAFAAINHADLSAIKSACAVSVAHSQLKSAIRLRCLMSHMRPFIRCNRVNYVNFIMSNKF